MNGYTFREGGGGGEGVRVRVTVKFLYLTSEKGSALWKAFLPFKVKPISDTIW